MNLVRGKGPRDAVAGVNHNSLGKKARACIPSSELWAPTVAFQVAAHEVCGAAKRASAKIEQASVTNVTARESFIVCLPEWVFLDTGMSLPES